MKLPPWSLASAAAIGSLAPDILLFYSKRFSMPHLTFSVAQYASASILYMTLAAFVAVILPYKGGATRWKAFAVGVALPLVISTAASFVNETPVSPRGLALPGSLLDLLAIL